MRLRERFASNYPAVIIAFTAAAAATANYAAYKSETHLEESRKEISERSLATFDQVILPHLQSSGLASELPGETVLIECLHRSASSIVEDGAARPLSLESEMPVPSLRTCYRDATVKNEMHSMERVIWSNKLFGTAMPAFLTALGLGFYFSRRQIDRSQSDNGSDRGEDTLYAPRPEI